MKFRELTKEEESRLENDREFLKALQKIKPELFKNSELSLENLQVVINKGPFTNNAKAELKALSTSFGDIIAKNSNLSWMVVGDRYNAEVCLKQENTSVTISPEDVFIKRIEEDGSVDVIGVYRNLMMQLQG